MQKNIKHILILWLLLVLSASAAQTSWNGKWHLFWKHGAFVMTLEQHGSDVNGSFEPTGGIINGTIKDNQFHATTSSKEGNFKFIFTMGQQGIAFFGNAKNGDWIAGIKVDKDYSYNALKIKDSSPFHTFYSFLKLGNQVRNGHYEALEKALKLLYFDEEYQTYIYGKRLLLVTKFFHILDACTIQKFDFNTNLKNNTDSVILHQSGTTNTIKVAFVRANDAEHWKIKLPSEEEMDTMFQMLMEAREQKEVNPSQYLQLTNPRDTMRTFIEQYGHWNKNGKAHVLSTMNLSAVDPNIWEWQAPLLSYYLLGVIDRISEVVYQEIPNDPKSKKPYVHFHHPLGNVIIAPYEVEGEIRWMFTPETLAKIEILFEEMEDIPLKVPTRVISENNLYFTLKNLAQSISPLLIKKFHDTAFWQLALLGLIVFLSAWISYFSKWIIFIIAKKFYLTKRWTNDLITLRFLRPVQILVFGLLLLYGAHQLGLPDFLFSIIKTFSHLLIVLAIAWIILSLINIIIFIFNIHAKRSSSKVDDIIFSLTKSILRILVVISAIFTIAEILNIPYKTVVAGLGIGGLAFAIAAKDTIANFFGSAIIIADSPFKTGDKIKIGSDIGFITNVGIRSTTIRTTFDTILTVPNNKITSEMIDNYSARDAMRVDTEFFLSLDTPKESLNKLDSEIAIFLNENKDVDSNKLMLTGVNDYTKRGISFGLTFFVKAVTEKKYSEIRHRIITELAEIIKQNDIDLIMINKEYLD